MVLAIALVVLAGTCTIYRLGDTPPGLYIDEVAIALTARSIWETGKDLLGNQFPLYPMVFPDAERPMPANPVLTYTAVPFAALGPGAWQARFPAVLWSWIAATGIGLCVHEMTRDRVIALVVGLTACLSPWLFSLGRIGLEAVPFPAITSLAIWALLRGFRINSRRFLVLSGALFGISLYTYSTARLLVPVTLGVVALVYGRSSADRGKLLYSLIPALILMIPFVAFLLRNPDVLTSRFDEVGIWSDGTSPTGVLERLAVNYLTYFSPRFLFLEGDTNLRHGTGRGELPWAWAPLLAFGIRKCWEQRRNRAVQLTVALLLVAPLAAALTFEGHPHSGRSISMIVFLGLIAGLGIQDVFSWFPRLAIVVVLSGVVTLDYGIFAYDYFGDYRTRCFGSFDVGKGVVLREALARRSEHPLYVPPLLHGHPRLGVYLPYWGSFPIADWLNGGASVFDVHPWRGTAPDGALIVHGWFGEPQDGTFSGYSNPADPPMGAQVVYEFSHSGHKLYTIYQK